MKLRRFKTRNGSILEELWIQPTSNNNYGYIDDYKIIKSTIKKFKKGDYICLLLLSNHAPIGGEHGKGWDIIEEVV